MPLLHRLKVSSSSIHGYGVIATTPFYKGEILVVGDGFLWREDEDFDDEYSLILPGYELDSEGNEGPSLYYDLTDQTRWINHACTPNTQVETSWDEKTKTPMAWWIALHDIEAGQELTYDYAFSAHLAIPCSCKSSHCRGLIVDEDELDDVPEELQYLLR